VSAISCCMLAIAMCLRLMVMRDNRIRGCVCVATAVHGELDQRYTVLRLTKFSSGTGNGKNLLYSSTIIKK
jgi:hypothetical protein